MSEPTMKTLRAMWQAGVSDFGTGADTNAWSNVYAIAIAAHKAEQALQVQAEGLTGAVIEQLCLAYTPGFYHFDKANKELAKTGMRHIAEAVLFAARPQAAEPEDERARFEAWAYTQNWRNFTKDGPFDTYTISILQCLWLGWQAHAGMPFAVDEKELHPVAAAGGEP